jgi:hypothetical protein
LGLQGVPEAAPVLLDAVRDAQWDEGWNYRGMGQFGMSMSQLDMTILALARTGSADAAEVIAAKVRQLDSHAAFSHCRVVGIAAALLRDTDLTAALADLLRQPGMQGHAQVDTPTAVRQANAEREETQPRNDALRELYLARGLFLAGDCAGLGQTILQQYTHDLRGPFARHARAILNGATAEEMA